MAAGLIVDLGSTAWAYNTISSVGAGSGIAYAASGAIVGTVGNALQANTFCNVQVAGTAVFGSGQLRIAVQTSATNTSGTFTDPTSGLPQMPTWFSSGGILIINSGGLLGGTRGALQSGQAMQSGFCEFAAFLRPASNQFVRAIVLSGDFYAGDLSVNFISQLKTTGSGGGFTLSPSSGVVSV